MEIKIEFKKVNIKNCMCYYFDDIMKVGDIVNILLNKKYAKIFQFITFHTKNVDTKPL